MLKDIRFRIEYGALRTGIALLRLLPLDQAATIVGYLIGWVAPWTSLHKRALANMALAFPEWSDDRRKTVAAAMWRNTGRIIAETVMIDRIVGDETRIAIPNREWLEGELKKPGPHIGITLHMGNWEIAGIACSLCGGKLAGVYRPLANPYIDRFVRKTRAPNYPAGLMFKGRVRRGGAMPVDAAAVAAINVLRGGGMLGIICDQVDKANSFSVPFFGHPAKFTPAPAVLARHVGARLWIGRCRRLGNQSRFEVDIRELEVLRSEDRNTDLERTTTAMAQQFELWIRETPEQWMWWLRRSFRG